MAVHETAQIENATLGTVEIREYVTIHDADIDDGVQIYEGASIKKATIHGIVRQRRRSPMKPIRASTE